MAAVGISRLTKRFGDTLAVDDLTFEVREGSAVGLVGPNGAGKTTTLRALLGLIRPTSGEATFFGRPYRQLTDPPAVVGAVLERAGFHPGRSGRDNLRVVAAGAGVGERRVRDLLDLVDLAEDADRRVGTYSLGMRQRLAVAAALLGDPRVLVLDEPANGLDPKGIRWLRLFIRDQVRDGRAVLVSSHVLPELSQTVDEVVILNRGKLVVQSSIQEVLTRAGTPKLIVRTPLASRLAGVLRAKGFDVQQTGDEEILVAGDGAAVGGAAAEAGIPIHEMTPETSTLEDVFLELTSAREDEA